MTSSPVQHTAAVPIAAAAVPIAAAAIGHKTVEQLPVAAQAHQPTTPAPESLLRASNGMSRSNATAVSTQHDPAACLYSQHTRKYALCRKTYFWVNSIAKRSEVLGLGNLFTL